MEPDPITEAILATDFSEMKTTVAPRGTRSKSVIRSGDSALILSYATADTAENTWRQHPAWDISRDFQHTARHYRRMSHV